MKEYSARWYLKNAAVDMRENGYRSRYATEADWRDAVARYAWDVAYGNDADDKVLAAIAKQINEKKDLQS